MDAEPVEASCAPFDRLRERFHRSLFVWFVVIFLGLDIFFLYL